ncbi:MAG: Trep_Strep domain-containing protein [Clostridium sp.]|nr:Trep_Strep domain-containing protein [Clostridium sp.]
MDNKLQAKDLINVGVFTTIYFIVFFACCMLGYIPLLLVLDPVICPIVAGIPFMLYLTKIKKFGMITITGIISGVLMFIFGNGVICVITGLVFGLLADLIVKSGKYSSAKKAVVGYGVFSLWLIGMLIPMFIMRDSYFESLRKNFGDNYVDTLMNYVPNWSFFLILVLTFIAGLIGAYLGKRVLKKHFERAGIV